MSAGTRPASRASRSAITGRLATAKAAETSRSPSSPNAEVGDHPGEQEVERRAAAFLEHDLEELVERMAADEERERLVLVRRPRHQLVEQEAGRRSRDRGDAEPEPVGGDPRRARPRPRGRGSVLSGRSPSSFAVDCRC